MTGVVLQVSVSAGGVPNHAIGCGDVTAGGIAGDGWRHPQFHGIPKRAILLITAEGLDEIGAMGFPVYPGALGENLTTHSTSDRRAPCASASVSDAAPRPSNSLSFDFPAVR